MKTLVFKSLHKVFKRDKIVYFGNEIFDEIIRFTGMVGTNGTQKMDGVHKN